jgi:branched-chain amino acid transport system substrate-binding protein
MRKNAIAIVLVIFTVNLLLFVSCKKESNDGPATLRIGVIVPLTGNAGVLGDYSLKGFQLAVEEQNKTGGLLGKKIELDIEDSKADPKEGVTILKNMLEGNQRPFMIYSIMSGVTLALKPITESSGLILLSAVNTDKLLENSMYTIQACISAKSIGQNLSIYLRDSMMVRDLTMFYANNEFGISVKDAVVINCAEKGITVQNVEPFEENSLDYKSLIAAKITKSTECVYVAGVGTALGTMLKQIKESGYAGKIISDPLITFPDVVNVTGDAIKGIPYLDYAFDVNSQDTNTIAFVKAFRERFGANPQNYSVITYDGARMLFKAIENEGSLDVVKIVDRFRKMKDYQGVFGKNSVENRNILYSFTFRRVK